MTNPAQLGWTDRAFMVCGHPLRRALLCLLDDADAETVAIDRLATQLASAMDLTTEEVRIELLHTHLPMLREIGFVEYDRRTATVRYQCHEFPETVIESGLLSCGEFDTNSY